MKVRKMTMKKRLSALLITILSCMFLLSGCEVLPSTKVSFDYDPATVLQMGEQFVQNWNDFDFESALKENGDDLTSDMKSAYETSVNVKKEVGSVQSIEDSKLVENTDNLKITETAVCDNGKAIITIYVNKKMKIESFTAEKYETFGQKMGEAALNTVFAVSFIFIVLIFIAFVIRLLPALAKAADRKKAAENVQPAAAAAPAPAPVQAAPVAEDDSEVIAAVIAAAIRAYSEENNVSTDGLYVRSIKRHNTSAWKKAV
jgi:sodium pump decarboxylase gamma subunit